MKNISFGPLAALIASLLIVTPQGSAQNLADSDPSEPARFTVAPHTSSRIAMKALPKATCVLHPEGGSGNSHPLKLFSDDDGMMDASGIRVWRVLGPRVAGPRLA
jgi:hypothetical protein